MFPLTFDPLLAAAVWSLFTAFRKAIPARWWSIDGRSTIWPMIAVLAFVLQFVHVSNGGVALTALPGDAAGYGHAVGEALITATAAILTHGLASVTGVQTVLETAVTLNGRLNSVAAVGLPVASAVTATLPPDKQATVQQALDVLTNARGEAQAVLDMLSGLSPAPEAAAPSESTQDAPAGIPEAVPEPLIEDQPVA